MSLENLKSKIKKVGKTRETEGSPAKSLARACSKNSHQNSRARAEKKLAEIIKQQPAVSKVVKKAACLADLMSDQDRADNMRVLREAKNAIHHVYDKDLERLVEKPDHKTRLAATALSLAYDEGLPVQRQVVLTKAFESIEETIKKIRGSPELMKALMTLQAGGMAVEAGGNVIDIKIAVQKTGSEKGSQAPE